MSDEKKSSAAIEKARVAELLSKIAELGGKGMKAEDIEYIGQKLVLPERWRGDLSAAIAYLQKKEKEEEQSSPFVRTFNCLPWDGAYNTYQTMKEAFGMVHGKSGFFQPPPSYVQVPISATETEEVPWGAFVIPMLPDAAIKFGAEQSKEFGPIFQLRVDSPRKHRFIIEGFFKLVEDRIKEKSIYRGKAIDGQDMPNFLDLTGFDKSKVVYATQTEADLHAHLWDPIRHSAICRKEGLPAKRAVLLHGPYGTGKSLAGLRTAVESVGVERTFVMARPGQDDFKAVMQRALLLQPSIVFMEDVDGLVDPNQNADQISGLLDVFDGIRTKNADLMIVLTTNHPDKLHKGMMRPGRLDALIEISNLDGAAIQKLFESILGDRLDKKIDWAPVVEACEGYLPAFLKETADRTIRYAISRNDGETKSLKITTEDLVFSANGLRPQYERMQDAQEFSTGDTLAQSLAKISEDATTKAVAQLAPKAGEEDILDEVWNRSAIEIAQTATAGKR